MEESKQRRRLSAVITRLSKKKNNKPRIFDLLISHIISGQIDPKKLIASMEELKRGHNLKKQKKSKNPPSDHLSDEELSEFLLNLILNAARKSSQTTQQSSGKAEDDVDAFTNLKKLIEKIHQLKGKTEVHNKDALYILLESAPTIYLHALIGQFKADIKSDFQADIYHQAYNPNQRADIPNTLAMLRDLLTAQKWHESGKLTESTAENLKTNYDQLLQSLGEEDYELIDNLETKKRLESMISSCSKILFGQLKILTQPNKLQTLESKINVLISVLEIFTSANDGRSIKTLEGKINKFITSTNANDGRNPETLSERVSAFKKEAVVLQILETKISALISELITSTKADHEKDIETLEGKISALISKLIKSTEANDKQSIETLGEEIKRLIASTEVHNEENIKTLGADISELIASTEVHNEENIKTLGADISELIASTEVHNEENIKTLGADISELIKSTEVHNEENIKTLGADISELIASTEVHNEENIKTLGADISELIASTEVNYKEGAKANHEEETKILWEKISALIKSTKANDKQSIETLGADISELIASTELHDEKSVTELRTLRTKISALVANYEEGAKANHEEETKILWEKISALIKSTKANDKQSIETLGADISELIKSTEVHDKKSVTELRTLRTKISALVANYEEGTEENYEEETKILWEKISALIKSTKANHATNIKTLGEEINALIKSTKADRATNIKTLGEEINELIKSTKMHNAEDAKALQALEGKISALTEDVALQARTSKTKISALQALEGKISALISELITSTKADHKEDIKTLGEKIKRLIVSTELHDEKDTKTLGENIRILIETTKANDRRSVAVLKTLERKISELIEDVALQTLEAKITELTEDVSLQTLEAKITELTEDVSLQTLEAKIHGSIINKSIKIKPEDSQQALKELQDAIDKETDKGKKIILRYLKEDYQLTLNQSSGNTKQKLSQRIISLVKKPNEGPETAMVDIIALTKNSADNHAAHLNLLDGVEKALTLTKASKKIATAAKKESPSKTGPIAKEISRIAGTIIGTLEELRSQEDQHYVHLEHPDRDAADITKLKACINELWYAGTNLPEKAFSVLIEQCEANIEAYEESVKRCTNNSVNNSATTIAEQIQGEMSFLRKGRDWLTECRAEAEDVNLPATMEDLLEKMEDLLSKLEALAIQRGDAIPTATPVEASKPILEEPENTSAFLDAVKKGDQKSLTYVEGYAKEATNWRAIEDALELISLHSIEFPNITQLIFTEEAVQSGFKTIMGENYKVTITNGGCERLTQLAAKLPSKYLLLPAAKSNLDQAKKSAETWQAFEPSTSDDNKARIAKHIQERLDGLITLDRKCAYQAYKAITETVLLELKLKDDSEIGQVEDLYVTLASALRVEPEEEDKVQAFTNWTEIAEDIGKKLSSFREFLDLKIAALPEDNAAKQMLNAALDNADKNIKAVIDRQVLLKDKNVIEELQSQLQKIVLAPHGIMLNLLAESPIITRRERYRAQVEETLKKLFPSTENREKFRAEAEKLASKSLLRIQQAALVAGQKARRGAFLLQNTLSGAKKKQDLGNPYTEFVHLDQSELPTSHSGSLTEMDEGNRSTQRDSGISATTTSPRSILLSRSVSVAGSVPATPTSSSPHYPDYPYFNLGHACEEELAYEATLREDLTNAMAESFLDLLREDLTNAMAESFLDLPKNQDRNSHDRKNIQHALETYWAGCSKNGDGPVC